MSDSQSSILSAKIESASFDLSQYPRLVELNNALGKALAIALTQEANVSTEFEESTAQMRDPRPTFSVMPNGTAIILVTDESISSFALISVSPILVSALSERSLSGEFEPTASEATPTKLDFELSQIFFDAAIALIDKTLPAGERPSELGPLDRARIYDETDDLLREIHTAGLFNMSFDFKFEEELVEGLVTYHFPAELLDRFGLLKSGRVNQIVSENTRWFSDMLTNVRESEVELDIVLDRYKSSFNQLSKLNIGDVVPLTPDAHEGMGIMLDTASGLMKIGTGKLGVLEEQKAVKLTQDLEVQNIRIE